MTKLEETLTGADVKASARPEGRADAPPPARRRRRAPSVLFWFMVPGLALLALFSVWPTLRTIYLSLTNYRVGRDAEWIGIDNYVELFSDPAFARSVGVTGTILVLSTIAQLVLAWILALLFAQSVSRMGAVFRTILIIPMMLSPIVVGIAWRSLLDPQYGWINNLLGIQGFEWLGEPTRALYVITAIEVWQWTPFLFMIISAGLVSIPPELREAASVDGAGSVKTFRHVILPLMVPVMLVGILLRSIDGVKLFDLVFALTQGGPGTSTQTVGYLMYTEAFSNSDQGYAAAIAVLMLIFLVVYSASFIWMLRRFTERISG